MQASLRIIHVTDVYKLDNFPSLRTLILQQKAESPSTKVISILTGDFLAPYLLSALDKGIGMMTMLNETPVDFLSWGNHEADLEHEFVCQRAREYKGCVEFFFNLRVFGATLEQFL